MQLDDNFVITGKKDFLKYLVHFLETNGTHPQSPEWDGNATDGEWMTGRDALNMINAAMIYCGGGEDKVDDAVAILMTAAVTMMVSC